MLRYDVEISYASMHAKAENLKFTTAYLKFYLP